MADSSRIPLEDAPDRKGYGLGGDSKRADAYRRRNLRIAIRQLERAELYLVALYSLDVDDFDAETDVDDLLSNLRSLHRRLLRLKLAA